MPLERSARWFWLSLAVVAADRATKAAVENWTSRGFHRTVIAGFFYLVHTRNPGIAFSLFADAHSRWFAALLLAGSVLVVALLAWLLWTGRAGGRRGQAGVALIIGGAAGNMLDRLLHGGVTDFILLRLGRYDWPAFNLADSAITIGAALVALEILFERSRANAK